MNLFKQIKILDTKNYTDDALLREKIEEKKCRLFKTKISI